MTVSNELGYDGEGAEAVEDARPQPAKAMMKTRKGLMAANMLRGGSARNAPRQPLVHECTLSP